MSACEWCVRTSGQIDSIEYENEVLTNRIQELETKLDKLRVLINAANCPQCRDKSGAYYDNNGEVSQCQWCYEVGCLDKTEDKVYLEESKYGSKENMG